MCNNCAHVGDYFPGGRGVIRPEHELNHLLPSHAKVENGWSCIATPLICLHNMDRNSLIFT